MADPILPCQRYLTVSAETVFFVGPPLEEGPLPALFYFSLSGEESLCLSPYNTPVRLLQPLPLRVFSMTLPGHGEGFEAVKALSYWAQQLAGGRNLLKEFFPTALNAIDSLINANIIDSKRLAVAGLSRGGLIAAHLAAADPRIKAVCGFAPWIDPAYSTDWQIVSHHHAIQELSLFSLIPKLTHTAIRFYIGNHDLAVGTEVAFRFIHQLASVAYQQRIRSPHAELFITPSIGHRGHGTSDSSFMSGANWLKDQLLS